MADEVPNPFNVDIKEVGGIIVYQVPKWPFYWSTTWGQIWSDERESSRRGSGIWLKWFDIHPRRHPKVDLNNGPAHEKIPVHKIVAEIFLGPCPAGLEILHEDDNHQNNRYTNLRYGTHKENLRDAVRNGRIRKGSNVNTAVLSDEQALKIKTRLLNGEKVSSIVAELGKEFYYPVYNIKVGRAWKHLQVE